MARVAGKRWLAATMAITAAVLLSCTSPTLPLPPPTAPSISLGPEPNTFKLRSENGSEPNALIIIVNRDVELARTERVTGTLADEQGTWDAIVRGKTGDFVDISQDNGVARSPITTVELR